MAAEASAEKGADSADSAVSRWTKTAAADAAPVGIEAGWVLVVVVVVAICLVYRAFTSLPPLAGDRLSAAAIAAAAANTQPYTRAHAHVHTQARA